MSVSHPSALIIGADFVPTKTNVEAFVSARTDALVDASLLEILENVDYSLFNLEVPLADVESPIDKSGPNLIAPVATTAGLKALCKGALGLANNHILDQGFAGLESTVAALDKAGIPHFGTGCNLAEASKPFFFQIADKRVGVYACAEHEFSIATEVLPGANPFDPLESIDHVRAMAKECDYAIVLYHGGKEYYRYPSPKVQKRCRKLVEAGAHLVVCQHSHCIGCFEQWQDGTIVYGQGNFLFDDSESEFWQTGLLIRVEFAEQPSISYIPLRKDGSSVRLADSVDGREILEGFESRSKAILEPNFIEEQYTAFARRYLNNYLFFCIPNSMSIAFRVVNKILAHSLPSRLLSRIALLALLNAIECEAHNELFAAGLRANLGLCHCETEAKR